MATTTSVVFPAGGGSESSGSSPGATPTSTSPSSFTTSPRALTAARAPTRRSPSSSTAVPMPPGADRSSPDILATVAPVPAPTCPSRTSSLAASQAARPSVGPGRARGSPVPRSNSTAAGTIGTRTPESPTSNPIPRSSSQPITPSAAARPKALPPVRSTASTCSTSMPGRSRSVSRVPGAPPRTSPDPTVPGGQSTTVQPVRPTGSVQCPTRIPGMRVITRTPVPPRRAWTGARAGAAERRAGGRGRTSRPAR